MGFGKNESSNDSSTGSETSLPVHYMTERMQKGAPVDTGYLRRSINMNLLEAGLTGIVGPTADYAPYVEYGTRFMSAQPYVRPAFNYQKVKFMAEMKALVK